jgi:hypothetical protein
MRSMLNSFNKYPVVWLACLFVVTVLLDAIPWSYSNKDPLELPAFVLINLASSVARVVCYYLFIRVVLKVVKYILLLKLNKLAVK